VYKNKFQSYSREYTPVSHSMLSPRLSNLPLLQTLSHKEILYALVSTARGRHPTHSEAIANPWRRPSRANTNPEQQIVVPQISYLCFLSSKLVYESPIANIFLLANHKYWLQRNHLAWGANCMAMWSRALLALRPHRWAVLPLVFGVQTLMNSDI